MNDNGNKTTKTNNRTNNSRRALGRGLKDILSEQSIFDSHFNDLQEHVKAARIGAAILELIDIVEAKYQPVIFQSVSAYRAVAQEESTEEIGRISFQNWNVSVSIVKRSVRNRNDDGITCIYDNWMMSSVLKGRNPLFF